MPFLCSLLGLTKTDKFCIIVVSWKLRDITKADYNVITTEIFMQYVLFNPLANNGKGEQSAHDYLDTIIDGEVEFKDVTTLDDLGAFVGALTESDSLIIAGGDGTLNRFINAIGDSEPKCAVDYVPTGSGNDFKHDVGGDKIIRINEYIKNLPTVTVNGKSYKFINGIGYGIDGYCCEVGDEQRKKSTKPVNYTSIAINGLLFHYKRTNATVTVDGETREFKKVWLAPTMKGRYYGGGMMVAPSQDRCAEDGKCTCVVLHDSGKLHTLMVFPSIFKGEHIKHDKIFTLMSGYEFNVKFDRPVALQIDGETVLGVTEYSVSVKK